MKKVNTNKREIFKMSNNKQGEEKEAKTIKKVGRMTAEGEVKTEITKGNVKIVRGGETTNC